MRWPFTREKRQTDGDYSDTIAQAIDDAMASELADPRQAAIVEACVSRWTGPFAAANVEGRFGPRIAPWLRTIVRDLALHGNSLLVLNDGNLTPAIYNDVTGGADPRSWTYHIDEAAPSSNRYRRLPADAVLHFMLNPTGAVPWRGRSPLAVARATSKALAAVEQRVEQASRQPAVTLVTFAERKNEQQQNDIRAALRGAGEKGKLAIVGEGAKTDSVQPPFGSDMANIRKAIEGSILLAYGLSPALMSETVNGAAFRELERQFIGATLMPVAAIIQNEIALKTGMTVKIDLSAQKFIDLFSQARAFKTLVDAGMTPESAAAHLGIEGEFNAIEN